MAAPAVIGTISNSTLPDQHQPIFLTLFFPKGDHRVRKRFGKTTSNDKIFYDPSGISTFVNYRKGRIRDVFFAMAGVNLDRKIFIS